MIALVYIYACSYDICTLSLVTICNVDFVSKFATLVKKGLYFDVLFFGDRQNILFRK